jgi:hypothetical protein
VRDGAARFISVQNEYSLMHRQPETDVLRATSAAHQLPEALVPPVWCRRGGQDGLQPGTLRRPKGTRFAREGIVGDATKQKEEAWAGSSNTDTEIAGKLSSRSQPTLCITLRLIRQARPGGSFNPIGLCVGTNPSSFRMS